VIAPHPTDATIVFIAYAGEEQGLYGSDHFAQVAKDEGWNVQGVLNMDIVGSRVGENGVHEPHAIRLFSEGRADGRDPGRDRAPAWRSAARTTGSRASSPATSRRSARTAPPT
jgi:Zn-dependent M28 family amino/carboxypeptidase